MLKFSAICLFVLMAGLHSSHGQVKYEREFRIRKEQFPEVALEMMQSHLEDVRRLRFYKEIDSNRSSYEIKFKKARLHYSVEFNPKGALEDVEVRIKPVDLPDSSWEAIEKDLKQRFSRYKIRKIQQQYPRNSFDSEAETLQKAFQNLLVQERRYELIVQARTEDGFRNFEILFDSEGEFLNLRKSLPPNYDHVLY